MTHEEKYSAESPEIAVFNRILWNSAPPYAVQVVERVSPTVPSGQSLQITGGASVMNEIRYGNPSVTMNPGDLILVERSITSGYINSLCKIAPVSALTIEALWRNLDDADEYNKDIYLHNLRNQGNGLTKKVIVEQTGHDDQGFFIRVMQTKVYLTEDEWNFFLVGSPLIVVQSLDIAPSKDPYSLEHAVILCRIEDIGQDNLNRPDLSMGGLQS